MGSEQEGVVARIDDGQIGNDIPFGLWLILACLLPIVIPCLIPRV